MAGLTEHDIVQSALLNKDPNYQLAYMVALANARSGNEKISAAPSFGYMLQALDAADEERAKKQG